METITTNSKLYVEIFSIFWKPCMQTDASTRKNLKTYLHINKMAMVLDTKMSMKLSKNENYN